MGEDPDRIREEIGETRAQMGDTMDAIGYKADVKSRARGYVSEKKDALVGKTDAVTSRVSDAVPDTEAAKHQARRAVSVAQQNPLGFAFAGAAVGFVVGLLVPSTRVEDERIGTVADDLKDRVRETSQEALDRGKQVAQEAGESALETARERGQEEREELASSLKENAQEVRSGGTPGATV